MQKLLHLKSRDIQWTTLAGKVITNKHVRLSNYHDIHLFRNRPIFSHAETLFVTDCDKNFTYYWVDHRIFPNVKNLYLVSHPCNYEVVNRIFRHIHLSNRFAKYARHSMHYNVTIVEDEYVNSLLDTFENETIMFAKE